MLCKASRRSHPSICGASNICLLATKRMWSKVVQTGSECILNEWISQYFGYIFPLLKNLPVDLLYFQFHFHVHPHSTTSSTWGKTLSSLSLFVSPESCQLVTTVHPDSLTRCKVSIQLKKSKRQTTSRQKLQSSGEAVGITSHMTTGPTLKIQ